MINSSSCKTNNFHQYTNSSYNTNSNGKKLVLNSDNSKSDTNRNFTKQNISNLRARNISSNLSNNNLQNNNPLSIGNIQKHNLQSQHLAINPPVKEIKRHMSPPAPSNTGHYNNNSNTKANNDSNNLIQQLRQQQSMKKSHTIKENLRHSNNIIVRNENEENNNSQNANANANNNKVSSNLRNMGSMPINTNNNNFFLKEGGSLSQKKTKQGQIVEGKDDNLYKGRFFIENRVGNEQSNKNFQSSGITNNTGKVNHGNMSSQRWGASLNQNFGKEKNSGKLYNTAKLRLINNLVSKE